MIQVASRVLALRYRGHANDVRSIVKILFSAEDELLSEISPKILREARGGDFWYEAEKMSKIQETLFWEPLRV